MSTSGIRPAWYRPVAVYVSMVALAVACVLWANHVADESNRHWCGVLRTFHDAYQRNPQSPTERGRDIQTQLEQLYVAFRCDTVREP